MLEAIEYQVNYINIIKKILEGNKTRIKLEREGKCFHIQRDIGEGDPLITMLFTTFLEYIFKKLHWNKYGIKIIGTKLSNLKLCHSDSFRKCRKCNLC